jgi:general secretion pathway protein L
MLILHLPHSAADATHGYAHALVDGVAVRHSSTALAVGLPRQSGEVVALVPHSRLAWFSVQLPPASQGARLTAVVEGLLEERLLDAPQTLHIATAPDVMTTARAGGKTWVAVCDKQWLREVLSPLQAAGVIVQRLVPEFTPLESPVLQIIGSADHMQCVLCHAQGVTLLPPNTAQWRAFGVSDMTALPILSEPATLERAQQLSPQPPVLQSTGQRWQQACQTDWDLAQGEWAQGRSQRVQRALQATWQTLRHAPAWRAVRWGLVSLLLVQVLALNAMAWRERSELRNQQIRLQRIVQETFPHVSLVIDAPLQMQREINALAKTSGALGPQDFESMLAALGNALPEQQIPRQLDYVDQGLRVQGVSLEDERIQNELHQRGYRVHPDSQDSWLLTAEGAP